MFQLDKQTLKEALLSPCSWSRKRWTVTITASAAVIVMVAGCAICAGMMMPRSSWTTSTDGYLYIDHDDTPDSVRQKSGLGWRMSLCQAVLGYHLRTGRYATKEMNAATLFRHLRNGQQEPVRLTIPCVRTMDKMAGYLAEHMMMSSSDMEAFMSDSTLCATVGYTPQTIPAIFVPNTYEVYWDTKPAQFMARMKQENEHFWNTERRQKAQQAGLTPVEVATLASIIDEETANNAEKPAIAGMYINRLHQNMPLQADPTVKFAVGDFTLRRIYNEHLKTQNPYNTYINTGLPPGPIRVASIAGIEAVLNYQKHPYLYMCAKEDFSGTHRFAATYAEHLQNARKYAQALNERGIK